MPRSAHVPRARRPRSSRTWVGAVSAATTPAAAKRAPGPYAPVGAIARAAEYGDAATAGAGTTTGSGRGATTGGRTGANAGARRWSSRVSVGRSSTGAATAADVGAVNGSSRVVAETRSPASRATAEFEGSAGAADAGWGDPG